MTGRRDVFVHERGLCESDSVGGGTRVWAFAHVMAGAVVGVDCNICGHSFIETGAVVGDRVVIKNGVQVWDGVTLEDDVFVGPNATFTNDPTPRANRPRGQVVLLPTRVMAGATLGANATVLCGTTIGAFAFVAAGAVVTRGVAAHALVVGDRPTKAAHPACRPDREGKLTKTTCIRKADWLVAWDERGARHVYARDADLAFTDNEIVHVGGRYPGRVDEEIDGAVLMVMPGLIDIHCHPSTHAMYRGYTEEYGNPRLFNSGRDQFRQAFQPDAEALQANAAFTLAELLAGGVTTIADLSHAYAGWLDLLAQSGIRACVAPMYRSARWYADSGQETKYEWSADGGRAAFAEAWPRGSEFSHGQATDNRDRRKHRSSRFAPAGS